MADLMEGNMNGAGLMPDKMNGTFTRRQYKWHRVNASNATKIFFLIFSTLFLTRIPR